MFHRTFVFIGLLFTLNGTVQGAAGAPDVAARFSTSSCAIPCQTPQSREWYFWRGQDRVEIRDSTNQRGELWRRDPSGRLSFTYLEPAQGRGIEYDPTDLKLIQFARPWAQLASIVSPAELEKLTPSGETEYLGRPAILYKGQSGTRQTIVTWLPQLQLAAKVENLYPDRRTVTELQAFLTEKDGVAATTEAQLRGFQLVDFADVGDMETDASMAWVKQSAAPGHESHHH